MPEDYASSGSKVGALIPNAWFDVIGRIVPGSFLILGLAHDLWDHPTAIPEREGRVKAAAGDPIVKS